MPFPNLATGIVAVQIGFLAPGADTLGSHGSPGLEPPALREAPSSSYVPPRPTKRVSPEYPRDSRAAEVEGSVWVEVTVDTLGAVIQVRAQRSETELVLTPQEVALRDILKEWTLEPMMLDGTPIPSRVRVPIRVEEDPRRSGHARFVFKNSAVVSWPQSSTAAEKNKRTDPVSVTKTVFPDDLECRWERGLVVVLEAEVSETGEIRNVVVAQPLIMAELTRAAVLAAKKWQFAPATQDGRPVKSRIVIPFAFYLKK